MLGVHTHTFQAYGQSNKFANFLYPRDDALRQSSHLFGLSASIHAALRVAEELVSLAPGQAAAVPWVYSVAILLLSLEGGHGELN